jgi:AraC family transcriptional regulator
MTHERLDVAYTRRIERVIEYICAHLGDDLPVERLSAVAGFSKFHFHRQFSAFTGLSVAQFVRLMRLKRAAYQLAFDPARPIIEIALDAGFSAPESFSRAFKDVQGRPRASSVFTPVGRLDERAPSSHPNPG